MFFAVFPGIGFDEGNEGVCSGCEGSWVGRSGQGFSFFFGVPEPAVEGFFGGSKGCGPRFSFGVEPGEVGEFDGVAAFWAKRAGYTYCMAYFMGIGPPFRKVSGLCVFVQAVEKLGKGFGRVTGIRLTCNVYCKAMVAC